MLLLVLALSQAPIELQSGMIITQSVRVIPKTYRLAGPPIIVRGNNITVDFRGAILAGIDPQADPDQARDTAIVIDGGSNIRIVQATIHGYKVGILARGTRQLTLRNNDLSDNWKPRLFSLVEHESLLDWLSFHHNNKDEWLRFGAAIYLLNVQGAELHNNIAVGGMNGLLLVRSNGVMVRDNNFSFNSGLGIGLYRSSDDTIIHNQLDYNVRGYSHRFYKRGQDSADLLLFEQSSRNVVALNSLTHGGDGVFLWAGQTTMDSGTGGANDNLFYGNDAATPPRTASRPPSAATRSSRTVPGAASTGCGAAIATRRKSWGTISAATAPASRSSTARTMSSPTTDSITTPRRFGCGPIRSSPPTGAIRNITTPAAGITGSAATHSSAIARS